MKRILLLIPFFVFSCASHNNGEGRPFKVHSYTVSEEANTRILSFPGKVKAAKELSLAFKVSGKIQNIYVNEGSFVKKGTLLAEIDPGDYRNLLDAADAKFNQISAEAGRVIRLYGDSVVSANDYDKARYGLRQAEASLEFAKRQVDECKLYAPVDGYVQKRIFEPASVVASGLPVINLLSAGIPLVEIEIPVSVYMDIAKARSCTARFSDNLIQPVKLEIDNIQPKANANQLYAMTFSITSRNNAMPKPGMAAMVDIEFILSDGSDMDTSVPSGALFEMDGQSYVWIIKDNGTVHAMPVTIVSLDADGMAVIEEVIEQGSEIVTAGVHKLSEGDRVEPMERPSSTNEGGIL